LNAQHSSEDGAEAAAGQPEDEARIAAMESNFIETLARGRE